MIPYSGYTWADLKAVDPVSFLKQAFFAGKPQWSIDQMPDLSGKVAIVTGGNTGIGRATAKALLDHNAKVYIGCRNQSKAEAAIRDLHVQTGKYANCLNLDLADLKSVKAATEEFISKESELHILFNNAGVMYLPMEELVNGYDPQIFINVIGHFYLTKLLLPILLSTAKKSPPGTVRVVNTSSSGMYTSGTTLDFASFKGGPARNKYMKWNMYFQSKYANVVFANELARRYGNEGIVSSSVNPGNIQTELNRSISRWSVSSLGLFILQRYPPEMGALTQLWAGTSPEGADFGGKFLIPWARLGRARPDSDDPQLGKELWTWLEEQVVDV